MFAGRKQSSAFGRRTGKNVVAGKIIRKDKDGFEVFSDYWTDSEDSGSSGSGAASTIQRDLNIVQNNEQANFSEMSSASFPTTKEIGDSDSLSTSIPVHKSALSTGTRIHKSSLSTGTCIHNNSLSFGTRIDKNTLSSCTRIDKNSLLIKKVSEDHRHNTVKPSAAKKKSSVDLQSIVNRYDEYDLEILRMINENASTSNSVAAAVNNVLNRSNKDTTDLTKTSTPKKQELEENTLTEGKRKLNLSTSICPLQRNLIGVEEDSSNCVGSSNMHQNINEVHENDFPDNDEGVKTRNKRKMDQTISSENFDSVDSAAHNDVSKTSKAGNSVSSRSKKQKKVIQSKDVLHQTSSSPKKRKKKNSANEITEKNNGFMRRSTRKRFKPLAIWRNERIIQKREKYFFEIVEVDKGTAEDDPAKRYVNKKILGKKKESKPKKSMPKKAKLVNVTENRVQSLEVLYKFSLFPWVKPDSSDENEKYPFLMKKLIDIPTGNFGYIQVEPGKEKPVQYIPYKDLHMVIVRGKGEICIQENSYNVEEKDMFIVPAGCSYTIKNFGKKIMLISYTIGKFKFKQNI